MEVHAETHSILEGLLLPQIERQVSQALTSHE